MYNHTNRSATTKKTASSFHTNHTTFLDVRDKVFDEF